MSAFLKNWTVKGLGSRCLRPPPFLGFVWGGKGICRFGILTNANYITPVMYNVYALHKTPFPTPFVTH